MGWGGSEGENGGRVLVSPGVQVQPSCPEQRGSPRCPAWPTGLGASWAVAAGSVPGSALSPVAAPRQGSQRPLELASPAWSASRLGTAGCPTGEGPSLGSRPLGHGKPASTRPQQAVAPSWPPPAPARASSVESDGHPVIPLGHPGLTAPVQQAGLPLHPHPCTCQGGRGRQELKCGLAGLPGSHCHLAATT